VDGLCRRTDVAMCSAERCVREIVLRTVRLWAVCAGAYLGVSIGNVRLPVTIIRAALYNTVQDTVCHLNVTTHDLL
jgi:hypothetical protein